MSYQLSHLLCLLSTCLFLHICNHLSLSPLTSFKSCIPFLNFVLLIGADDDNDVEGVLPKEDATTSNGASSGYVPRMKSQLKNDGPDDAEKCQSEKSSNSEAKPSKLVKRNKWKEEEVKKLIGVRGELNDIFQFVTGKNVLWEEISKNLLAYGINKNPGQCKSMWTSLLQKYEEIKNEKNREERWLYLEDMERVLSDNEALAKI